MRFATLIVVLGLFGAACDETASAPAPAPAPAPDPDAPTILSGEIAADMTLTADVSYLLRGAVFVADGATLTIEAGTTIYGEGATNGALVVARGGRLVADGAPDAPIVFTSDQEVGFRARGDWGGLIINGRAPLNIPGNEAEGEGGTGAYGGDDPADDSGVLRYVRVEFAGSELSPDNELNGVAFQGVGSGTVVDSVQVHLSKDDGVEFFGGTVDARRVVCTGIGDDSFDWTEGWTGRGQFWIARQRGDDADQGIEADSNAGEQRPPAVREPDALQRHPDRRSGNRDGRRERRRRAAPRGNRRRPREFHRDGLQGSRPRRGRRGHLRAR